MRLHPAVASWFARTFPDGPTEGQQRAIPLVADGKDLLLSSPTGTGKTLAGFLAVLSALLEEADAGTLDDGIQCVYVSPLKALVHDVARNLQRPLAAIDPERRIRVGIRTGETKQSERARHVRSPPHIMVTTPESLALMLTAPRLRAPLGRARWVLVDEVHALAGTKRGAHLALALERLQERCATRPARIGMSATVNPLEGAGAFLTGGRPCRLVEVRPRGPCRLTVDTPHPDPLRARGGEAEQALYARLDAELNAGRTTLVFTNTRTSAERIVMALRDRGIVDGDVSPHHGSMSKDERALVEDRLAKGQLRGVVASSSLELGIHVDDADRVVLLGSCKSAARALQRVGRSGHKVGGEARGVLLATDPDELLESIALAQLAHARDIEPLSEAAGGLDVLAQHLVALCLDAPRDVDEALVLTRGAWPYRELSRADLVAVLRHLRDDARLLLFHEEQGIFAPRSGRARWVLAMNAGAIPRAGLVRVLDDERYVGEVEEAFAASLEEDDIFQLGGALWRFRSFVGLVLRVAPARGKTPTVPAWRSEGLSMSDHLARATRPLIRGLYETTVTMNETIVSDVALERVREFLASQATDSALPPEEGLAWESFVDDDGRRALVVHALVGRRTNEAFARAIEPRVDEFLARGVSSEMGFAILAPRSTRFSPRSVAALFAEPLAIPHLESTDLYLRRFRHVAERGLLLQRNEGTLRRRQAEAERVLDRLPEDHPLRREARREALEESLDLPGAERIRAAIASRSMPLLRLPERPSASPFAACILAPRASGIGDGHRLASLRDRFERASERVAAK